MGGSALLGRPELARRVELVEAERAEELVDVDTPDALERVRALLEADTTPEAKAPGAERG